MSIIICLLFSQVKDGTEDTDKPVRFCGSSFPRPIFAVSGVLTLTLVSEAPVDSNTFKAEFYSAYKKTYVFLMINNGVFTNQVHALGLDGVYRIENSGQIKQRIEKTQQKVQRIVGSKSIQNNCGI